MDAIFIERDISLLSKIQPVINIDSSSKRATIWNSESQFKKQGSSYLINRYR